MMMERTTWTKSSRVVVVVVRSSRTQSKKGVKNSMLVVQSFWQREVYNRQYGPEVSEKKRPVVPSSLFFR